MSKRLLLADDSITIQKVIGITFANEDFQLDIVDNGNDALEHARAQKPDMILADVYMPGRNGYELCSAVKQDPALRGVPVMLLTGTFEPFDEAKAVQAGADGWIAKPFESQVLIDRVEELMAKAAAAPTAVASAEPVPAVPVEQSTEPVADEAVAELEEDVISVGDDDIWGDVSFDEEDLVSEVAETGLADIEEEPVAEASVADVAAMPADDVAVDSVWDEGGDDIFDLEDGDIIDEADLLEDFSEPEPIDAPDHVPVQDAPVAASEPEPVAPVAAEVDMELVEEEALELEEPAISAEPLAEEEELAGAEWNEQPDDEPVVLAEPEVAQVPPAAPAVPVAASVPSVDEQEVAKIVERVANEVVERLAGTLLERIAWEVVPDLAENLIKDEIRKIKAGVQ